MGGVLMVRLLRRWTKSPEIINLGALESQTLRNTFLVQSIHNPSTYKIRE